MNKDIRINDSDTSQSNMSLPTYPDFTVEESNIMRTDFNNWNLTDFTVTDV